MPSVYGEVQVTCGSREEAKRIADELVTRRLAACVHLTPIDSVYEWDGTIEHDQEIAVSAKTRRERFEAVAAVVTELHSYDLPAITFVDLDGSPAYLAWIDEQTTPAAP